MFSLRSRILGPKQPMVLWLLFWVLALPLIHVHPEADHQHGAPSHAHGGIVHTVFSGDLSCEFSQHSDYISVPAGQSAGRLKAIGPFGHTSAHPEIGFSLLTTSPDRQVAKLLPSYAVASVDADMGILRGSARTAVPSSLPALPIACTTPAAPRAPPCLFI